MCLGPEALALAAATGIGGTLVNANAQSNINSARAGVLNREGTRQKRLDDENQALLDAQLSKVGAVPQLEQAQQASQVREAATQPPVVQPQVYSQATSAAPTEVKTELAAQLADAIRRGRGRITALSKLQGQSDANLSTGRDLTRSLTQAGMLRNLSQGSADILPLELEGANRSAQGQQVLGDILGGVSGLAGLYAVTGAGGKQKAAPISSRTLVDRPVASAYSRFAY